MRHLLLTLSLCLSCLAQTYPVQYNWSFETNGMLHLEWLGNNNAIYKVLQSQSVDLPVSNWFVAYTIIPGGTSNIDAEFSITQYPSSFFTITETFGRSSMLQTPKNLTVTSAPLKKQNITTTNSVSIIPELMPLGWKQGE